jgi:hypothetical protein
MYDSWDVVALVFFLAVLAVAAVCWLVSHVNRNNPLSREERKHLRSVTNGKRAMASDR